MAFFDTRGRDIAITTDGTAKDAGDVVGGLLTIPISPNGQDTTGKITRLHVIDDDAQAAALKIYFFDSAPASIADDAAFTLSAANIKKIIGSVSIATGDYVTIGSERFAEKDGTDVNIEFSAPSGTLYAYVVCTATPTYSASGLSLRIWVQRD